MVAVLGMYLLRLRWFLDGEKQEKEKMPMYLQTFNVRCVLAREKIPVL